MKDVFMEVRSFCEKRRGLVCIFWFSFHYPQICSKFIFHFMAYFVWGMIPGRVGITKLKKCTKDVPSPEALCKFSSFWSFCLPVLHFFLDFSLFLRSRHCGIIEHNISAGGSVSPLGAVCPTPCVIFRNIKLFTWVFDLFLLLDHCWPFSLSAFKLYKVRDPVCPVHHWISGSLKGAQHIIGTYQLSAGWLESL